MRSRSTPACGTSQVTCARPGDPVVAPHLPGFGGTPDAGPVMAMGAAADRCLQALDAAGVDRMVVCGLSMGGYVAFELWRMARERVAGPRARQHERRNRTHRRRGGSPRARRPARGGGERVPRRQPAAAPGRGSAGRAPCDRPGPDRRPARRGDRGRRAGGWPNARTRPPTSARSTCRRSCITSDGDALIPPDVTAPMADRIPGAAARDDPRRRASLQPGGARGLRGGAPAVPGGGVGSPRPGRIGPPVD